MKERALIGDGKEPAPIRPAVIHIKLTDPDRAMIVFVSGFLAGCIHVFSGPDHLAAVAPLAVQGRGRAWSAGLRWGLGHALGAGLMGAGSLALRGALPLDRISNWNERLVGVVLVGIGLWGLRQAFGAHVHSHEHVHAGQRHIHIHAHRRGHGPSHRHAHGHAALGVGLLHGLAGGSHFAGVLPALALPSTARAALYVFAYAAGTISAMTTFSTLIRWLAIRCEIGGAPAYRRLVSACSWAALSVGCAWLVW